MNLWRLAIAASIIWLLFVLALETVAVWTNPAIESAVSRAELDMTLGLVLIWVVVGGCISLLFRNRSRAILEGLKMDRRLKFFLFAAGLSLVEEAVTTGMTNLAPEFGVKIGRAYITASANYLDVVLYHSVIVLLPMFGVWALLLGRYSFGPISVMLLYGITGVLAETFSFGLQNLVAGGLWIVVYGLMVYLPAYSVPSPPGLRPPGPLQYLMAVVLPIAFAVPVALAVMALFHRPAIEFSQNAIIIPVLLLTG